MVQFEGKYTCIGKGGSYSIVALAKGAGQFKGESFIVYTDGTQNYIRTVKEFEERMELLK